LAWSHPPDMPAPDTGPHNRRDRLEAAGPFGLGCVRIGTRVSGSCHRALVWRDGRTLDDPGGRAACAGSGFRLPLGHSNGGCA
jgi:hypothetical protein